MGQGAEEVEQQGGGGTQERPDWLPEKFKSEQELVESYTQLENRLREQGTQIGELEQTIEKLVESEFDAPQEQQGPQLDPLTLMDQYEEALINGDARTAMAIQIGLAQAAARDAIGPLAERLNIEPNTNVQDRMFAKLAEEATREKIGPDYEEIRKDVAQVLSENPHLMPDTDDPAEVANAIALVADAVRHQKGTGQSSDEDTQRKLAARTLRGRSSGGTPEAQELRGAIRAALENVKTTGYSR